MIATHSSIFTVITVALLLAGAPVVPANAGSAGGEETVVVLTNPVGLQHLSDLFSDAHLSPVSLDHLLPGRGGFVFGQTSFQQGIQTYRKVFSDLYPKLVEPLIFSFRVKGRFDKEEFADLGFDPVAVEVVPEGRPVALLPAAAVSRAVPREKGLTTPELLTPESPDEIAEKPWVPASGDVNGELLVGAELPRKIFQTMSWESEEDIAAFTTDVYEHNLQLINRDIQDLNPVAFGSRPVCAPGQGSDFWASNDGAVWGTTFPAEAGVYTDTTLSDDCFVMDFTVGLFHPTELVADQNYSILVRADGSAAHDSSNFELRSEKLSNDCGLDLAICVGVIGAIPIPATANDRIIKTLIPESAGCTLPGVYAWDRSVSTPSCLGTMIDTYKADRSTSGAQANDTSFILDLDATGDSVLFSSYASNLTDESLQDDVRELFVHRRSSGTTIDVSVSTFGDRPNDISLAASISGDGQAVAFDSYATNLSIEPDLNGQPDIFLRDISAEVTTRVLANPAVSFTDYTNPGFPEETTSLEPAGWSGNPKISSDGRLVAFESSAPNFSVVDSVLCSGHPRYESCVDVFVHDRATQETRLVSTSSTGVPADSNSQLCEISSNGRHVLFMTDAANLVPGDGVGTPDLFVKDLTLGTTSRVSSYSGWPWCEASISGDGRWIAFQSDSSLLPGGSSFKDIFLLDRDLDADGLFDEALMTSLERVSRASDGTAGNGYSDTPDISSDGSRVAFASDATNLSADDTNYSGDIFMFDRLASAVNLVSVGTTGAIGDSVSMDSVISHDGRVVGFRSCAGNLVPESYSWCGAFVTTPE